MSDRWKNRIEGERITFPNDRDGGINEELDLQINKVIKSHPRSAGAGVYWSEKEIYVLRKTYGKINVKYIQELIPKRSANAIMKMARKQGLT